MEKNKWWRSKLGSWLGAAEHLASSGAESLTVTGQGLLLSAEGLALCTEPDRGNQTGLAFWGCSPFRK